MRKPTWLRQSKIQALLSQLKNDPKLTPHTTCQHPLNSSSKHFLMYSAASLRQAISFFTIWTQMYSVICSAQSFISTFMSQNLMSVEICMLGGTQSLGIPARDCFSYSTFSFSLLSFSFVAMQKITQITIKNIDQITTALFPNNLFIFFDFSFIQTPIQQRWLVQGAVWMDCVQQFIRSKQKMLGDELIDQQELKKKQEKLFEQQKKFRNLETDKKLFAEETINFIKKQKMSIDKLKKQNQALKELIAKVNNEKTSQSKFGHNLENMKELLNEITNAIQEQKETQKNIDIHIANFQKKIVEKKKNCLGINSGAESQNNLQKQIKILENRLDKANQKFNETIAVNKELKLVIDSLRKERVIFDNLYKKLESQLHEKRKKMADIIEKANNAYEDRDKANNQVNSLKQQAKKQAGEFEKEIKEISHLMEKIKLSSYAKKTKGIEDHSHQHSQHDEIQATENKFVKQTKKSSEQMEKIQKFREDFAKIQAATEIDNFDQLLRIFSKNEEKNFQMFKFVNLQSNQIEELEFEVAKLKEELGQGENLSINEKEKYLLEMEDSLRSVQGKLKDTEGKYKSCQKEARSIMGLIQRIFQTIECDREVVKEIGGSKSISETNLLVFLAVIEHKATQIINTFNKLSNANMLSGQGQAKTAQPQPGILTFQDFEDNEEYDKILTADQLRKKAADFISKQQNQKQKKKEMRPKKK